MISGMFRVKDGRLVPIEEAEQIQTEWDFENTVKAVQELVERLEMAKRPDLAEEVWQVGARFVGGLR